MSDKFVKALISAAQAPDEESGEDALPWVVVGWKIVAEALTFSPSIISYAGEQGGNSEWIIFFEKGRRNTIAMATQQGQTTVSSFCS